MILLIILSLLLSVPVIGESAQSESGGLVLRDDEMIDIYGSPYDSQGVIGRMTRNVLFIEEEVEDAWYRVELDTYHLKRNVYVHIEGLTNLEHVYVPPIWVRTLGDSDQDTTPLYSEPDDASAQFGQYLPGTYLELIAVFDDFAMVEMGSSREYGKAGYVKIENIERTDKQYEMNIGIEHIGFVEVVEPQDSHVTIFPDRNSTPYEFSAMSTPGATLELIADLGEWYQVRGSTDTTLGFVPAKGIRAYLYRDLIPPADTQTMHEGQYWVGVDMPSGIYTYVQTYDQPG